MRVVEANDVLATLATFALNTDQIFRIDVVTVVCGIRPRIAGASGGSHDAFVTIHPAEQNSAAFVRISFFAVAANRIVVRLAELQHWFEFQIVDFRLQISKAIPSLFNLKSKICNLESHPSSQNLSLKYLSPESHRMVTKTAGSFFLSCRAIWRHPTTAAAAEM